MKKDYVCARIRAKCTYDTQADTQRDRVQKEMGQNVQNDHLNKGSSLYYFCNLLQV